MAYAAQDPHLVVTARDGRAGETTYKTFNVDAPRDEVLESGWLYMVRAHGPPNIVSRIPGGGGIGISNIR